mmetsp:Transcript_61903/g.147681  ORF Transcript_61903/g.147681 Transcript_61903/m.147681 type:complete len:109 (+) Transcript_61903:300-626(+)
MEDCDGEWFQQLAAPDPVLSVTRQCRRALHLSEFFLFFVQSFVPLCSSDLRCSRRVEQQAAAHRPTGCEALGLASWFMVFLASGHVPARALEGCNVDSTQHSRLSSSS